jgi:hypothetical protein
VEGVEALGFSTVEGVEDVEALPGNLDPVAGRAVTGARARPARPIWHGRSLPPAAGVRMGWEPFGGQRRPTVVTL